MLEDYSDSALVLLIRQSTPLITTRVESTRALSHNLIAKFVNGGTCYDEISALQQAWMVDYLSFSMAVEDLCTGYASGHLLTSRRIVNGFSAVAMVSRRVPASSTLLTSRFRGLSTLVARELPIQSYQTTPRPPTGTFTQTCHYPSRFSTS
jgi:hypothetical protein